MTPANALKFMRALAGDMQATGDSNVRRQGRRLIEAADALTPRRMTATRTSPDVAAVVVTHEVGEVRQSVRTEFVR